jgi:hypothetical protein
LANLSYRHNAASEQLRNSARLAIGHAESPSDSDLARFAAGAFARQHRIIEDSGMQFIAIQPGIQPLEDYVPVGVEVQCPRCAACYSLCAKKCQWSGTPGTRCQFASVACAKLRCDLAVSCCGAAEGHCLLEFTHVFPREAVPPSQ